MTLSIAIKHRQGEFNLEADLEIGDGLTALFGPSGSGKTTLVNLVSGLVRPQTGRIAFDGDAWVDTERRVFVPPHRRRIGYVFQEGRLFPHMTVRRNLEYGARFAPKPPSKAEFEQIVELLAIGHLLDRRPGGLSGGEKQRVAFGRALMSAPRLLLMDEPLSALDVGLKASIMPYIERIRDEAGIPVLYVSHSIEEVTRLATRVVAVSAGRVTVHETAGGRGLESLTPAGNFLEAVVEEQSPDEGLTIAKCKAGTLFVRHADIAVGAQVRVFVPSNDIVLATGDVGSLSTLNRLPGVVESLVKQDGGVAVTVDCHGDRLMAQLTTRSAAALELAPGKPATLLFKAVSLGPEGMFRHPAG